MILENTHLYNFNFSKLKQQAILFSRTQPTSLPKQSLILKCFRSIHEPYIWREINPDLLSKLKSHLQILTLELSKTIIVL